MNATSIGAVLARGLVAVLATRALAGPGAETPPLWFPVGEELVYQIKWGIIPVGTSRVTTQWVEANGKRLLAIRYRVLTNMVFDKIYPMNDFAESLIDPDGFRSIRFTFSKKRWRQRCNDVIEFDHESGQAHWRSYCTDETRTFEITPGLRDIVAFMYFLRRDGLEPGLERGFRVVGNDAVLDLRVRAADGGTMKLRRYGKVPTLLVVPELDLKGLLIEDGEVKLWVSRDARRVATKLAVRGPLADVKVTLCGVRGPGDDRWTAPDRAGGEAECAAGEAAERRAEGAAND